MQFAVDKKKLDVLMAAQDLNVTNLIALSGLSRQGYYNMFKDNYQPVAKGVLALAEALGVTPLELVSGLNENTLELQQATERAAAGDARSFEVLPALLVHVPRDNDNLSGIDPVRRRLLSAAAQLAYAITGQKRFASLADVLAPSAGSGFFFGQAYMPVTHIVERTPEPMKRRNVFGVFELSDFERHFA